MTKRSTIEDMQKIAEARGGKCLSTTYINALSKILWQCQEGHQWEARPNNITAGGWCPVCAHNPQKSTIEQMQDIAEARSGKCLSATYINTITILAWQCQYGHRWEATPRNIAAGTWCPVCADNTKKSTIEQMQDIAEARGGKCLSTIYVDAPTKLTWQCNKGHRWRTSPTTIKQGAWCPTCAINRINNTMPKTIEQMRDIAEARGGKCLSKTYSNTSSKILWQCQEGHQWEATPDNIRRHWCPACGINKKKKTIEDMQKIAEERGGKCLSSRYINALTKLTWQCKEGHQWQTTPATIKHHWCPACSHSLVGRR